MWGIYSRVSDPRQAREGLSIDAQIDELKAWALIHGYDVRIYKDEGVSAWTDELDKRPAFKAMLDAVERSELAGIAATHVDRMARDDYLLAYARRICKRHSAQFITLDNPSADPLYTTIMGALGKRYSDEHSRKVRRGLTKRAQLGLHVGTLPFGYCSGHCSDCKDAKTCERWDSVPMGASPILHPHDHAGVRLAFLTYRQGTHSDDTIADLLNAAGYRSRKAKMRILWTKHSVSWLLTNRTYTGKVMLNEIAFEGKHAAIISDELFEEVRVIRRQHRFASSAYTPKYRIYLFGGGLLVCSGCGRPMRGTTYSSNSRTCYRCTTYENKNLSCPKPSATVRSDVLDEQMDGIIRRFRMPANWRERVEQLLAQNGRRVNAEQDRRRLRDELTRLKTLFRKGHIEEAEYDREHEALSGQLASLTPPRERELLSAGESLKNLTAAWDAATLQERRGIVRAMFDAVICDPTLKQIVALKPKPSMAPYFRHLSGFVERNELFEIE
jgi:DNA invertase Pin-like site-specific DNA recombinase